MGEDRDEAPAKFINETESQPSDIAYVVPATVVETIGTDDSDVIAAVETGSPIVAAVEELAATLGRRIDALQAAFDREIRAEATREKVVDRLHAELQEYKTDLLLNLLRPIFVDLIQLHDDVGKIIAAHPEPEESDGRLLGFFNGFRQGIEDILYRQGVEAFEVDDDAFDPRRQRAFSTQTTDDPSRTKRIAARLRKGFRAGDKVIRPEIVSVYALRR